MTRESSNNKTSNRITLMNKLFHGSLLSLLILLTACGQHTSAGPLYLQEPTKVDDTFTIHILDKNFEDLKLGYAGYEWDQAWPVLQQVYVQSTIATITNQDIDEYDWSTQTIKLTKDATQSLKSKFNISPTNEINSVFGVPHRAFVVTLGEAPIYGGLFLERWSQMGITYPVIYIDYQDNGNLALTIRPFHTVITGDPSESDPVWNIVRPESVRDALAKTGKLIP